MNDGWFLRDVDGVRTVGGSQLPPDPAPSDFGLLPGDRDEYVITSGALERQPASSPATRAARSSASTSRAGWPGGAAAGDIMNVLDGERVERKPKHLITIGQLAAYAGVTIKAVRHYHRRGLLEEPPRDSSGYRRYGARHAIELVKIKTLAEAGVPLARVQELLAADPERFAAAIAGIDRSLRERAEELRRTRERIARLGAGDRLFVSAEVAAYLDRLRQMGVSERTVQLERDGWILMQSASPRNAAAWIAEKLIAIDDPEFRAIYIDTDAAFDWSPDDPRLLALADRTRRWLARRPGGQPVPDVAAAKLVATTASGVSPAWDRLSEMGKKRPAGR